MQPSRLGEVKAEKAGLRVWACWLPLTALLRIRCVGWPRRRRSQMGGRYDGMYAMARTFIADGSLLKPERGWDSAQVQVEQSCLRQVESAGLAQLVVGWV